MAFHILAWNGVYFDHVFMIKLVSTQNMHTPKFSFLSFEVVIAQTISAFKWMKSPIFKKARPLFKKVCYVLINKNSRANTIFMNYKIIYFTRNHRLYVLYVQ